MRATFGRTEGEVKALLCTAISVLMIFLGACSSPGTPRGGSAPPDAKPAAAAAGPVSEDVRKQCEAKCPAMSDVQRLEYFKASVFRGKLQSVDSKPGVKANSLTGMLLVLRSDGKGWDDAAREAGLLARVSPGAWTINVYVTPKESVLRMSNLASEGYNSVKGPGDALISGFLRPGEPLIEIWRKQ